MLPTRFFSEKQEKQVAKIVGGRRTSNSGASNFCAGDVTTETLLYECKTVTKPVKSYSIKKEVLDKIHKEAFEMGKENAVLAFNFEPSGKNYFVLTEEHYKQLIQNK